METGIWVALIIGIAQVIAAFIALWATLNSNRNRKLKKDLRNYSREIYILNEELVSAVHAFSEYIRTNGINDITPLVDKSIINNLRKASTDYLEFNSSVGGECDEKLKDYMKVDNIKVHQPKSFQFHDKRRKVE